MISSLFSEMDKMKSNSEIKAKKIQRLNQIISVLEINIRKHQKQHWCNEANVNVDFNNNLFKLNYRKMNGEIKGTFDREQIGSNRQISELKSNYYNQKMMHKQYKETLNNTFETVVLNANELKINCNIMKRNLNIFQVNKK